MKKVVMSMVLMGLVSALAPAQTPQVRLLWEKNMPATNVGIDTLDGQPVFVVDGPERVVVLGPQGEEVRSFSAKGFPTSPEFKRMSQNGKFVASSKGQEFWERRGNSLPTLRGNLKDVLLIGVSNDGERRLGLKVPGLSVPNEVGIDAENVMGDTLIFFDRDGNAVARVPAPGLELAKFSPKGDVLFVRHKHYNPGQLIAENRFPLVAYDHNGRVLWREDKKRHMFVFDADTLNNLCNLEWDQTAGWSLAFYGIDGREQKRISILSAEARFNVYGSEVVVSDDGRYALLNAYTQGLFFVDKQAGQVVWHYTLRGDRDKVWNIALSGDGQYALASILDKPGAPNWGHAYLFDRSGRVIWQSDPALNVGRVWMEKSYFVLATQGILVFQILP